MGKRLSKAQCSSLYLSQACEVYLNELPFTNQAHLLISSTNEPNTRYNRLIR